MKYFVFYLENSKHVIAINHSIFWCLFTINNHISNIEIGWHDILILKAIISTSLITCNPFHIETILIGSPQSLNNERLKHFVLYIPYRHLRLVYMITQICVQIMNSWDKRLNLFLLIKYLELVNSAKWLLINIKCWDVE